MLELQPILDAGKFKLDNKGSISSNISYELLVRQNRRVSKQDISFFHTYRPKKAAEIIKTAKADPPKSEKRKKLNYNSNLGW